MQRSGETSRFRWLLAGGVAVILVTAGACSTPGPSGDFSPPSITAPAGSAEAGPSTTPLGLRTFDGDILSFEYPADWDFYPFRTSSSFETTIGYLASTPVDTDKICTETRTEASTTRTCSYQGYDLPPGQVVILLEYASWAMSDPIQFYEHPVAGEPTTVGEMATVFSEERLAGDRLSLTWKIMRPDAFWNWIQVNADMRGPGSDALRGQVEALIASFRFVPAPPPMVRTDETARAIVSAVLTEAAAAEPAAFGCYPAEPGATQEAVIRWFPSMQLRKPLPVTCSTQITATDIGLWKLELTATWEAAADREAGSLSTIIWLQADGSGGSTTGSGEPPKGYWGS